jgi:hypothetical protein
MMKTALILGIVFAAGCSKSDDAIGKLRRAKDEVCGCRTMECRLESSKAMSDLAEQIKANVNDYSAEQRQEMAKIIREVVECGQNGR